MLLGYACHARDALPGHPILPSEGSQPGVHDLAADSGRIPTCGYAGVGFPTQGRRRRHMTFQVAHAKRPLLAVSTWARAGNGAAFTTGDVVLLLPTAPVNQQPAALHEI